MIYICNFFVELTAEEQEWLECFERLSAEKMSGYYDLLNSGGCTHAAACYIGLKQLCFVKQKIDQIAMVYAIIIIEIMRYIHSNYCLFKEIAGQHK